MGVPMPSASVVAAPPGVRGCLTVYRLNPTFRRFRGFFEKTSSFGELSCYPYGLTRVVSRAEPDGFRGFSRKEVEMAYLKLKSPSPVKAGVRAEYALAGFGTSKSSIAQFPKKGAGDITATINGKKATIRLGSAANYAVAKDVGYNGYLRLDLDGLFGEFPADRPTSAGKGLFWISFAAGFDPKKAANEKGGLVFEFIDESCPTPNPKREPKNPKAEAARLEGFKNWAATKNGGKPVVPTLPEGPSEYETGKPEEPKPAEAPKADEPAKTPETV